MTSFIWRQSGLTPPRTHVVTAAPLAVCATPTHLPCVHRGVCLFPTRVGRPTRPPPVSAVAERSSSGTGPKPLASNVEQTLSPERGLGLALSQPCELGDLLLVSTPISLVYGSETLDEDEGVQGIRGGVHRGGDAGEGDADGEDEGEEGWEDGSYEMRLQALAEQLTKQKLTPSQAAWLELLSVGDGAGGGARTRLLPELGIDHMQLKGQQQYISLPSSLTADANHLKQLLKRNTFETASEDIGMALIAEREPRQEVLGLWPEYALLNHSCVPSTVSYVHNRALVTRVTRRNIAKGAELFTNYIGELVMSPLHVRREALQDAYGFTCTCARCKAESALDNDLQQLVKDVHEACIDQINDDLIGAIEEDDQEALSSIQEQAAAYVEVLGAALGKKKVPDRTAMWIQAGLFNLYEALHHCLEAQDCRDLGLTAKMQELAGAIHPGSDTHLYWTRVHLQAVQEAADAGQLAPQGGGGAMGRGSGGPGGRGRGAAGRGGRGFGQRGRGAAGADRQGVADGITLEAADAACQRAFTARYGAMSHSKYRQMLSSFKELDDDDDEFDDLLNDEDDVDDVPVRK